MIENVINILYLCYGFIFKTKVPPPIAGSAVGEFACCGLSGGAICGAAGEAASGERYYGSRRRVKWDVEGAGRPTTTDPTAQPLRLEKQGCKFSHVLPK